MLTLTLEEITRENLIEALQQVPLRLRRGDGQVFIVTKEPLQTSPFEVTTVPLALPLTAPEIVASVHEGRQRESAV